MNIINRLFGGGEAVDDILSDFNKLTARLRNAIDFHNLQVEFHNDVITEAEALSAAAQGEAERAARVVANIEKVIGIT